MTGSLTSRVAGEVPLPAAGDGSGHVETVHGSQPRVWISRHTADHVAAATAAAAGPLAGVTLGVKDNIDVAGFATTAGCPEFAYQPNASADCAERLVAAGVVVVGKTNMDQFATGLVGTRSPYGALSCVADSRVVSGGSSSGSAVAVALGECDVALGTDTAGSGRVPAALNGIFGLKPTRGLVSTVGVVPACPSVDCVSVFARTVRSARLALMAMADPAGRRDSSRVGTPPFGPVLRPRVGVPRLLDVGTDLDGDARALFAAALAKLEHLGASLHEIDFAPFDAAGDLLYGGPWVAERYAAVGEFIEGNPEAALDPTVREIILGAASVSAVDTFRGMYELDGLLAAAQAAWAQVDVLALPTVGVAPTHEEVAADPHGANTRLGRYTRFVNLMDLCAISIPAGTRPGGVPFGLQLVAPAMADAFICDLAERFEGAADTGPLRLAVAGAHLRGQPLNHQLVERGARFVAATRTAPVYRLFRLAQSDPPKPGLVHDAAGAGAGIEVEVWELGPAEFGSFVAQVPPPLAIGTVSLEDGTEVSGFVCEPRALDGATEITRFGGWRTALGAQAGR